MDHTFNDSNMPKMNFATHEGLGGVAGNRHSYQQPPNANQFFATQRPDLSLTNISQRLMPPYNSPNGDPFSGYWNPCNYRANSPQPCNIPPVMDPCAANEMFSLFNNPDFFNRVRSFGDWMLFHQTYKNYLDFMQCMNESPSPQATVSPSKSHSISTQTPVHEFKSTATQTDGDLPSVSSESSPTEKITKSPAASKLDMANRETIDCSPKSPKPDDHIEPDVILATGGLDHKDGMDKNLIKLTPLSRGRGRRPRDNIGASGGSVPGQKAMFNQNISFPQNQSVLYESQLAGSPVCDENQGLFSARDTKNTNNNSSWVPVEICEATSMRDRTPKPQRNSTSPGTPPGFEGTLPVPFRFCLNSPPSPVSFPPETDMPKLLGQPPKQSILQVHRVTKETLGPPPGFEKDGKESFMESEEKTCEKPNRMVQNARKYQQLAEAKQLGTEKKKIPVFYQTFQDKKASILKHIQAAPSKSKKKKQIPYVDTLGKIDEKNEDKIDENNNDKLQAKDFVDIHEEKGNVKVKPSKAVITAHAKTYNRKSPE